MCFDNPLSVYVMRENDKNAVSSKCTFMYTVPKKPVTDIVAGKGETQWESNERMKQMKQTFLKPELQ